MSFSNKKPLCKFINDCQLIKSGKQCPYSHDNCRFGNKCNNQLNCKFYHPELANNVSHTKPNPQNSRSTMKGKQCRFGAQCKKKADGQCPFDHNDTNTNINNNSSQQKMSKQQCKFGNKCKNLQSGTCRFFHPGKNPINPSRSNNSFQSSRQHAQIIDNTTSISYIYSVPNLDRFNQFREKQCKNFRQNKCPYPQLECENQHILTIDKSVRRIFSTSKINFPKFEPTHGSLQKVRQNIPNFNYQFIKIVKVPVKENNKKCTTVLAIIRSQNGHNIGFYEIDEQNKGLKAVTRTDLTDPERIIGLFTTIPGQQLIYLTEQKKIKIFNIPQGEISINQFQAVGQIIGIERYFSEIKKQMITVIAFSNKFSIIQRKNNQPIIQQNADKIGIQNMIMFKQYEVFGELMFIFGTGDGKIYFANNLFESLNVQLDINKKVSDCCVTKCHDKPMCFVALTNFKKQSSLYAIDLTTLQYVTVISNNNAIFSKVCYLYDKCFLGIDFQNILIFDNSDFRTPVGIIPVIGPIKSIVSEQEEGIIIVQETDEKSYDEKYQQGIVSIYRVRKPQNF